MDVQVQQVGVQQMPDHAPADATAKRDVDGVVHMTINTNPRDDSNAAHELGHEKDARTNTNQFFKDALQDQKDKRGPNEKAHNDRPVEQRANKFMDQVKQEVKQFQQQQKAEQKEQKKLKKTKKAKDN